MKGNFRVLKGLASAVCRSTKLLSRAKLLLLISSMFFVSMGIGQVIRIEGKNLSLKQVLDEVKKQSGYSVFIRKDLLDNATLLNLQKKNRTVEELLKEVTKDQQLDYQIKGKEIVLTKKNIARAVNNQASSNSRVEVKQQQQNTIEGIIVDPVGKPIHKATITSQRAGAKVESDAAGGFQIKVSLPDQLTISYVGFESNMVPVADSKPLRISLQPNSIEVEDVVVTGIFKRSEGNFTGATTSISGLELKKITSNNIFTAISAIDPSFQIRANNALGGNINQLPDIQLRGQSSFPNLSGELSSNPNLPLFILDGFEVNLQRIVDLDMNLIENITILKDASATAIYGSRGANGVMVISTITPKPGAIQVVINNDFRLSTPDLSVYNYLNAREKLDFETRAGSYNFEDPIVLARYQTLYNERYKNVLRGIDTDWKKIPTKVGINNRTSVNLQGGDEVIRYGIQAGTDLQQGVMRGQNRNNYSGQFDFSYQVKKFQFKNSLRVYQNKSNESPYGDFSQYLDLNPYWSPYDAEGDVLRYVEDLSIYGYNFKTVNPLYDATLNSLNRSKYFGFSNNFQIRYNILPNLYAESSLSLNNQKGSTDQFYSALDSKMESIDDISRKGTYSLQNDELSSYESMTTLNHNLISGKHQLFSTAAFNFSSTNNIFTGVVAEGFPFDRLDNILFAAQYQENGKPIGDESTVRRVGLLYNGSYSYDNRFLMDVSVKRDGSSQYGTDKRFGTFWSTGIGWNIHNEAFFQESDLLNRFKIRASYGTAGSLNIPAYSAQTRYGFGVSTNYYNELGAMISNLGNRNLSWQTVHKLNFGVDLVLFLKRLDVRLDLYRDLTENSLTQITLAPSTGFSSFSENLGKIENKGFEFSARYKVIENSASGTLWSVFVNGFTNKNILKELSNNLKSSNALLDETNSMQVAPNVLFKEGESINTIYAVTSLGIDPGTGSEIFLTKDGVKTFTWNARDKVAHGIDIAKWNGSFGTNVMHKGIELGVIFNYQYGGRMYNQTLIDKVENVDVRNNVDRRAFDLGWSGPGDISTFKRITAVPTQTKLTSRFVQDNNVLNLTSLSLGYNFYKSDWIKRVGLRSLQVSAITNDLFRISSIETERGITNPFARTFSFSLRVGL